MLSIKNINDWYVESGDFDIIVAASSRDPKLTATVNVESTVEAEVPDYRATALIIITMLQISLVMI